MDFSQNVQPQHFITTLLMLITDLYSINKQFINLTSNSL